MSNKFISTFFITESTTGIPEKTNKNTIKLHIGCDKKMFVDITLNNKKVSSYFNYHIRQFVQNSKDITAITVGPKTVLEAYYSNNLLGPKKLLINDTEDTEKLLQLKCIEKNPLIEDNINSLTIWDYDYYFENFGVRYCDNDTQCNDHEYCLCKGGQKDPGWCPVTKKRCLPVSRFIRARPPYPLNSDYIHSKCLSNKLSAEGIPEYITYAGVADRGYPCAVVSKEGNNMLLEGFSNNKIGYIRKFIKPYKTFILIFVLILFIIFARK